MDMGNNDFYRKLVGGIFGVSIDENIDITDEAKSCIESAMLNLSEEERKSLVVVYNGTYARAMRKLRNPKVSKHIRLLISIK